jgi:phage shock protein A
MNDIMNAKVFGAGHELHAITGRPIEQGHGALHADAQAVGHLGMMAYELAELTQRRKDHADKLAGEMAGHASMSLAHNDLAADDITGRQNLLHKLATQDLAVTNAQRQSAALAAEHEALTAKIADIRAKLTDEGIIARHGMTPANTWLGMIHQRGWSNPL